MSSTPIDIATIRKQRDNLRQAVVRAYCTLEALQKKEHDTDCAWQFCPVDECPICVPRRNQTVNELIKVLRNTERKNTDWAITRRNKK